MYPNVWGQGQLFAFSALDGTSLAGDDFCGHLLGDAYGIRFHSKTPRELRMSGLAGKNPIYDIVSSDALSLSFDGSGPYSIIYAKAHLIIGNCDEKVFPQVFVDGPSFVYNRVGVWIQDTDDEGFTALGIGNDNFAFAYGHSEAEVLALVGEGLDMDVAQALAEKKAFYDVLPEGEHALLRSKCLSVMKTQTYSPEGEFPYIWSTPDRYPHHHLWLWDSVFHAVGFRNLDPSVAEQLMLSVLVHQQPDGFIPHMADLGEISGITQPPVLAWGALKVYEKSGNKDFLRRIFDANKRFLGWYGKNRRLTEKELYTWNTGSDVHCRCDESGMDNSPRFDEVGRLFAIDLCCFMANDTRAMAKIADILGEKEDVSFFGDWNKRIAKAVNDELWSEEDGFYFDRFVEKDELSKVWSVASFLPIFSGVASKDRVYRLMEELVNPKTFGTPLPIPSIAASDKTFGSDMWRGPVWINYNYMICEGLRAYGADALAGEIQEKTVAAMERLYLERGTVYEFYDCQNLHAPCALNRKGTPYEPYNPDIRYQAIRDYGWSCTLLFDILSR